MKLIAILVLFIFSLKASGQIKNVYCEYHIISLQYKRDTIIFQFPQVITAKELGRTPIIPLYPFSKNEYGVNLELLISKVGLKEELIVGKCFYVKEGDLWKEIFKSANLQNDLIKANPCELKKNRDWISGNEGAQDFNFSYMQMLYDY